MHTSTKLFAVGLLSFGFALSALGAGTSISAALPAPAISNISYVNWSSAVFAPRGSAQGLIISNLTSSIAVRYDGEVAPASQIDDNGVNYWDPSTPYLSLVISNLPPTADIIALTQETTQFNTLTFSEPVVDPVLLIVSLGDPNQAVGYHFDAEFELLSQGQGYWGDGFLSRSEPDFLLGAEGHGAIQFHGTFSSLSWTVQGNENWHGFTVGIPVEPTASAIVPEGKVWISGVLIIGIAMWGWTRRMGTRACG